MRCDNRALGVWSAWRPASQTKRRRWQNAMASEAKSPMSRPWDSVHLDEPPCVTTTDITAAISKPCISSLERKPEHAMLALLTGGYRNLLLTQAPSGRSPGP